MITTLSVSLTLMTLISVCLGISLLRNKRYYNRRISHSERHLEDIERSNKALVRILNRSHESSYELVATLRDCVHYFTGHTKETDALCHLLTDLKSAGSMLDIRLRDSFNLEDVRVFISSENPKTVADLLGYASTISRQALFNEKSVNEKVRLCQLTSVHDIEKWYTETFSRMMRLYKFDTDLVIKDMRRFLEYLECTRGLDSDNLTGLRFAVDTLSKSTSFPGAPDHTNGLRFPE